MRRRKARFNGRRLKEIREIRGLTQGELARKTGLHITTIGNYEIGGREPKAAQVKVLAEALGVRMEGFFDAHGDGDIMKEKERKHSRRYLIADVVVKRPEGRSTVHALAVNISKEGIGLYSNEPLRINEKISVIINMIRDGVLTSSEEVPGAVRWVLPVGSYHAAGIQFDRELNGADFPILTMALEYSPYH
jgi:transcriptional regulator with XRE-family HTH domain